MNLLRQETRQIQSYRRIPLTKGQIAIVDACDYDYLSQWSWCAHWQPIVKGYYARRAVMINGKHHDIFMHRQVLGLDIGDKRCVDHRDSNTLDNRRQNLRIANKSQNAANQRINRNNTSGFKGVSFHRASQKWRAYITVNRYKVHLGYYASAAKAHNAYSKAARMFFGDFCRL